MRTRRTNKKRELLCFAALILIATLLFGCSGGGGNSTSPNSSTSGGSGAQNPPVNPTQTVTVTISPTDTAQITIRGRIVDANGNPVANARIYFYDERNASTPVSETRTDSQGYFAVQLTDGHQYTYRLEGGTPTVINVAGTEVDLGAINYTNVGVVTVVITLEENPLSPASLAGTRVSVGGSYEGTTDESGRVTIPYIPDNTLSDTGYEITVSRDGFKSQTITNVRVTALQATDLNLFDINGNTLAATREIRLQLNPGTKIAEYSIGAQIMDLCYVAENHLYVVAFDLPNKVIDYDLITQSSNVINIDLPSGYEKPMGIAWQNNQIYVISNNPFGNDAVITIFDVNFAKINTIYIERNGNDFQSIAFDSEGIPWIAGIGISDEIRKYNLLDFSATETFYPITAAGICLSGNRSYICYNKELKMYSGVYSEILSTFTFDGESLTGVAITNQGDILIGSSPTGKIYRLKGF